MDIQTMIRERLQNSEYWTDKTRENDSHIQSLTCPECGKNEAWAYRDNPFAIICNRKDKCGAITKTLELFPDITAGVEKKYPAKPDDPRRPATAYLRMRGLHDVLEGLDYSYQANVRGTGSGAVMFRIDSQTANGRLFNPPKGEGKSHSSGPLVGKYWRHPAMQYKPTEPTYITEGIINALSLIEMGYQAIAVLSSGTDPERIDLSDFANIVLAFDNDRAGKDALRKWHRHLKAQNRHQLTAILPKSGDWNDFLVRTRIEQRKERFEGLMKEMEFQARLSLAESPDEYVAIFEEYGKNTPTFFAFAGSYFTVSTKSKTIVPVSNFTMKVVCFEKETGGAVEDQVYRYRLEVTSNKQETHRFLLSADDLSSPTKMKRAFAQGAKADWSGDKYATNRLSAIILESDAPVVRQVQAVGYDPESRCYVTSHVLITPQGKVLAKNELEAFAVGREFLKSPASPETIPPMPGAELIQVYELLRLAWGDNGPFVWAWSFAALFVNQVKERIGFFPFLSLHGDPQTGKTGLATIMNAMQGLDEEGIPLNTVNTAKGQARALGQVSGMFRALLEAKPSDKNDLLGSVRPLYNQNALQVRAAKTNSNQTNETELQCALMFVQNVEPFVERPDTERVVSVHFDINHLNGETEKAFSQLLMIGKAQLAHLYSVMLSHREKVEAEWYERYEEARRRILVHMPDRRVASNHALVLAFHGLLCEVVGCEDDMFEFAVELAQEKQTRCEQRPYTVADEIIDFAKELLESPIQKLRDSSSHDLPSPVRAENGFLIFKLADILGEAKISGHEIRGSNTQISVSLREHPAYFDYKKTGRNGREWLFDLEKV
ncbi:MAG TPA: toprim domain-containing protein [Desulfovibrio sp.]|uniref:toprim domain-containing protein n=1 Tax=Desulfovibrio sp. TaxID=885 RepID=UPI002C56A3CC|nr:toprim domain-containing protein [Desulfovibrio sp.]HMM38070.1 toprim domain-containing protein [Desulfovibrio sp.]